MGTKAKSLVFVFSNIQFHKSQWEEPGVNIAINVSYLTKLLRYVDFP